MRAAWCAIELTSTLAQMANAYVGIVARLVEFDIGDVLNDE